MKQKHIESMNISGYKCAYCVNGNPHFYTILLERKRDYFLRNNVPNFSNSILLYLLLPKHWRNIHIYSITSTHKTYMVAPSLKLNTTIVTRVRTLGISPSSYLVWWSITFYENQEQFMSVADAWKKRDSIFFAVDK